MKLSWLFFWRRKPVPAAPAAILEPSLRDILESYSVEETAQAQEHIEFNMARAPCLSRQDSWPNGLDVEATMILRKVDGQRSYAKLAELTGDRDEALLVLADLRAVGIIKDAPKSAEPAANQSRAIARLTRR